MIVFLEKFVPANEDLISDHERKIKAGKRTRRFKPSKMFYEMHAVMREMLTLYTDTNLKPIGSESTYTIVGYYKNLSDFDRQHYDNVNVSEIAGVFTFEKRMPLGATA